MDNFFEVLLFLLGFGAVLFLTYVTTKYVAAKSNKVMKGKYIKIIETISLGTDKRIHLVKTGEQYILIASTSKSVEFLTTITVEEGEVNNGEAAGTQNVFDFKALFEKYVNNYKNRKNIITRPDVNDVESGQAEGEKFKSNLDRLRTITHYAGKQVGKDGDDVTNEK